MLWFMVAWINAKCEALPDAKLQRKTICTLEVILCKQSFSIIGL